jgi:glutamyl-tRNA reductase
VRLYDIDDLERVVTVNLNGRMREAELAEVIVQAEAHRFTEWRRGLAVAPTIGSLRERAESIRAGELERVAGQWESLGDEDRERVEQVTRAIVNKLLHEPTVRLRAAVAEGDGVAHVDSLRHLFDLEG